MNRKSAVFMLIMILAGSIFTVICLSMTGNGKQIYTDVVIEYTSIFSSNKSAERRLLYLLILFGILIYSIYFFRKIQIYNTYTEDAKKSAETKRLLCLFGTMAGSYYFISENTNPVLMASLLVLSTVYIVDKNLVVHGFVFFHMGIYAVYGIYRIYASTGGEQSVNSMAAVFMVLVVLVMILLVWKDRKKALLRGCLLGQLLIPAVMLVYTASKYGYNGGIKDIPVPSAVKVFIYLLMAAFFSESVYKFRKYWHTDSEMKSIISYGSCVCIMAFNRFSGTGAVIPNDIHHPFENIIGYSQVFELGQKLFSEYIPVSGMYSLFQGAVFQIFGNGEMGNYHVTQNVFYLLVVLIVTALLFAQMDRVSVFIISLIFYMIDYNRLVFVLPIMLLLMMPRMIARKNLWLKAWFLTSLFQGLYYPLFGAAVCVSFLPLGIYQMITYIKSKQLKLDIRTIKFWGWWGVCFIAAALCIPYLTGTYKHISAMSGQTIYADGIARFGQIVPDWFFSYLGSTSGIRIALYDIFSFMIPAGFVWIAYMLALKAGKAGIYGAKLKIGDIQALAVAASLILMPMVCYSFTFVRLDFGSIYARSFGILLIGSVLMLIIAERYLCCRKICYLVYFIIALIPVSENSIGFFSSDSKLASCITVPEGYIFIENDNIEKLGTCFIESSMYDSINAVSAKFSQDDKECSYLGLPDWFGYFYLCNIKGDGVMEIMPTIRGYEAAQEAIDIARENGTRIGTGLHPYYNYYLYHWLLTSGEYIWSDEEGYFQMNSGRFSDEEVREKHKYLMLFGDGLDVGKSAGSLGMSLDYLSSVLTARDIAFTSQQKANGLQLDFMEAVDGNEADYLYLEFSGMDKKFSYTLYDQSGEQDQEGSFLAKLLMKKNYNPGMQVTVLWSDENRETHTINCAMNQGKLLIPLGAGTKWMLHEHTYLNITVAQDGQQIMLPEIEDIRFFKLREAG